MKLCPAPAGATKKRPYKKRLPQCSKRHSSQRKNRPKDMLLDGF